MIDNDRYLRRRSSDGDLILDRCATDAEHMRAPPEAYDPENVNNWRCRCRTHVAEILLPVFSGLKVGVIDGEGQYLELSDRG